MRPLRATLLAIACAAAAWALVLALAGGVNTRLFGVPIRSNNPERALVIAGISLAGYFVAGGRVRPNTMPRLGAAGSALLRALAARPGLAATALALTLGLVSAAGSTRIAGGADAYGYVSQADLWLAGDLVVDQPWVADVPWPHAEWSFSPLGYRPAAAAGEGAIVPTYAPGLPLMLAAAKFIGGQCALFAVVPLLAAVGVIATYGIGKRLVSPWAGVCAAWLIVTSPAVLVVAFEPLTDIPVMTAWAVAIYLLLSPATANVAPVAAGLAAAIAILIRPNLAPLAAPLGLWYLVRRTPAGTPRVAPAALFALGALPGVMAIAFLNSRFYGSPLSSGYGQLEDLFAWSNVLPNAQRYLSWLAQTQTPAALAGMAALFFPSRSLWHRTRDLRILPVIAAFVALLWAQYFAYHVWESWGFLRFLLPSWPFIMIGVASLLVAAHDRWLSALPLAWRRVTLTIVALLIGGWTMLIATRSDVFGQRQGAAVEAPLGQLVRQHTVDNSVVLVWERSGTIRYYSGRTTLRYDYLEGEWLDRAVSWLRERGVHVYAVLDPNHLEQVRRRFAGQTTLAAFERPVFLYEPARTALYDLTTPPPPGRPMILYDRDPGGRPACDPPVEATPIVLR